MLATIWKHTWVMLLYCIMFFPSAILLYHVVRGFLGEPHKPGQFWPYVLLTLLSWCSNRLLVFYANGLNVYSTLIWHMIILWVVFHRRGLKLLLDTLKLMGMTVLLELSCSMIIFLFIKLGFRESDLLILTMEDMQHIGKLLVSSLLNSLGMLPLMGGLALWNKLRKKSAPPDEALRKQRLYTRVLLRVTALVVAALSLFAMPHYLFGNDITKLVPVLNEGKYLVLIICVGLMLLVTASYITQDIRYIMQLQRLNTLEHQQAISRSLLQNLRYFRHNMVNMLYGLEGVLLSGDKEKVLDYYREMQEKCALVNNENIAALERVTNPSVGAVLLHGMDKARQMNLPYTLYVQEQLLLSTSLKDTDLCQVLGVLQDNAIEAADKAEERFVSIELRNVDDAVEIIVKNTYSGDIAPDILTRGGRSTKEGHDGHGLESCYHILGRHKGSFLNFWVTGQYVQAQLLLER